VGIGTNSPSCLLSVNGDAYVKCLTVDHTATGDWSYASFVKVNRNLTKAFSIICNTGTGDQGVFTIYGNGIVNAKKIYAESFEVTMNAMNISWFDHVFSQDYKLMPLSELEQFIKQNRHLPDIPSETEIKEKGGFDLGEMNGLLLKKVEELTLYTIEQHKLIESLTKQIEKLQVQVQEIKSATLEEQEGGK
jgi:hypothetical protein